MMTDEEWVKSAMADDSMVVELLIRLKNHASPPPPPPPPRRKRGSSAAAAAASLPFDWSVRQRRSKQMLKATTARASPTTPLSWSGGGGGGGGTSATTADGFEESSRPIHRPPCSDASRSKLNASGETTTTKKSRKKKTLKELREEEDLLVKERGHLKRELASLRADLEKERAANESLKRMKIDRSVSTLASEQETLDQNMQNAVSGDLNSLFLTQIVASNDVKTSPKVPSPLGSSKEQAAIEQENKFVIPDLNMPFEDDTGGVNQ